MGGSDRGQSKRTEQNCLRQQTSRAWNLSLELFGGPAILRLNIWILNIASHTNIKWLIISIAPELGILPQLTGIPQIRTLLLFHGDTWTVHPSCWDQFTVLEFIGDQLAIVPDFEISIFRHCLLVVEKFHQCNTLGEKCWAPILSGTLNSYGPRLLQGLTANHTSFQTNCTPSQIQI